MNLSKKERKIYDYQTESLVSTDHLKTTKSSAIQIINILKINSNIYSNNKKIITYQTKNKIWIQKS